MRMGDRVCVGVGACEGTAGGDGVGVGMAACVAVGGHIISVGACER